MTAKPKTRTTICWRRRREKMRFLDTLFRNATKTEIQLAKLSTRSYTFTRKVKTTKRCDHSRLQVYGRKMKCPIQKSQQNQKRGHFEKIDFQLGSKTQIDLCYCASCDYCIQINTWNRFKCDDTKWPNSVLRFPQISTIMEVWKLAKSA